MSFCLKIRVRFFTLRNNKNVLLLFLWFLYIHIYKQEKKVCTCYVVFFSLFDREMQNTMKRLICLLVLFNFVFVSGHFSNARQSENLNDVTIRDTLLNTRTTMRTITIVLVSIVFSLVTTGFIVICCCQSSIRTETINDYF